MGERVHHRTCNLCEAMCGVVVTHEGGRVTGVRGDDADPLSRGAICPKAVALGDLHHDPDRLRRPQRRLGPPGADARWEDVSWDEALDDIARRLVDIQARHGRHAVAHYVGNPTVHNYAATLFGVGLMKAIGSRNKFSATSVDQLPHMLAALKMFGHQLLLPVPDVDRAHTMLMLGANPLVSNGSLMSAPGIKGRLRAMQRRGGRLIVVDPRRTETARMADEHLFIRPAGDAAWLAALAHDILDKGRADLGRLAAFTDGIDALEKALAPFSPEAVAGATGIAPDVTKRIAKTIADAPRAVIYGRLGVCTQAFGGVAAWLCNVLNVLTGNLDREGGAMFTTPAVDVIGLASAIGMRGHFDKSRSRVRGLPEFGGEYPAVALAEEIETPGDRQIRALITSAGNPVLSTPNGPRLEKALVGLDLMVSIDIYRNETTRFADYILPPTSQLEQGHYDLAFHALAVRNTAKYSPPLFEPPPGAKADWQIQLELACRIGEKRGGAEAIKAKAARAGLGRLGPEGILDGLLRAGPHGMRRGGENLSLKALRDAPHGVDLGALERRFPERLQTRDKRIALAPDLYLGDLPRLEAWMASVQEGLTLIGRRQLRTNNSWLHNSERMAKGRDRCTLLMHPDDAASCGVAHAERVTIRSRVGEVEAPLHVTDSIMPGVVSLPHGFGHKRPGVGIQVAEKMGGVSANDLTDEREVDALTGTACLTGTPVQVAPAG